MTSPFTKADLGSPRTVVVWALVGYAALYLGFAFFDWILPGDGTFSGRSAGASFDNIVVMAMPVLAVLLATQVTPALAAARLIAAVALIEYAVSLFFGFITLLIGLGAVFESVNSANDGFDALDYLVMGLAGLALIAAAAYVVVRAYTGLGGRLPVGQPRPDSPIPPA